MYEHYRPRPKVHPAMAFLGNFILDRFGMNTKESDGYHSNLPEIGSIAPVQRIKRKAGAVILIIGKREAGKTVLAQRLGQVFERPTYSISPEQKPPSWITEMELKDLNKFPPRFSTVILDDIPAYMSSRDYHNPLVKVVEGIIPVVRHKRKIFLIFCTQTSSQADRYILDADLVILKPFTSLYADLERPAVKKLADRVMPIFRQMSEAEQKRCCYIFSDTFTGLARIDKPSVTGQ